MDRIRSAIAWGGGETVMLSMFVVSEADVTVGPRMSWEGCRPRSVRPFELEDAAGRLGGRRVVEYDAVFSAVPDDLVGYLSNCLHEAMDCGAELAWFAFEGSFDFELLLGPEMAPQVYALADGASVAVATDELLSSDAWRERVVEARDHLALQ